MARIRESSSRLLPGTSATALCKLKDDVEPHRELMVGLPGPSLKLHQKRRHRWYRGSLGGSMGSCCGRSWRWRRRGHGARHQRGPHGRSREVWRVVDVVQEQCGEAGRVVRIGLAWPHGGRGRATTAASNVALLRRCSRPRPGGSAAAAAVAAAATLIAGQLGLKPAEGLLQHSFLY